MHVVVGRVSFSLTHNSHTHVYKPNPTQRNETAPTGVAIGKKLLQLMGWKEGLGVGSRQTRKRRRRGAQGPEADEEGMDDAAFLPEHLRAQAAEAGLVQQGRIAFARRDVASFALPTPKDDLYGLGFDPDKHAPEFAALREAGA